MSVENKLPERNWQTKFVVLVWSGGMNHVRNWIQLDALNMLQNVWGAKCM